jgi:hypothetical protein
MVVRWDDFKGPINPKKKKKKKKKKIVIKGAILFIF